MYIDNLFTIYWLTEITNLKNIESKTNALVAVGWLKFTNKN